MIHLHFLPIFKILSFFMSCRYLHHEMKKGKKMCCRQLQKYANLLVFLCAICLFDRFDGSDDDDVDNGDSSSLFIIFMSAVQCVVIGDMPLIMMR